MSVTMAFQAVLTYYSSMPEETHVVFNQNLLNQGHGWVAVHLFFTFVSEEYILFILLFKSEILLLDIQQFEHTGRQAWSVSGRGNPVFFFKNQFPRISLPTHLL